MRETKSTPGLEAVVIEHTAVYYAEALVDELYPEEVGDE